MSSQRALAKIPVLGRLAWLMGLYAENFEKLRKLCDLASLKPGSYCSSIGDGLDLDIEVLEVHRHTIELRISYRMTDPSTGAPDPSVVLLVYVDSRQVEASHCYIGKRWQDLLGNYPSAKVMMGHRLRMNSFLNKWLAYLLDQGHSTASLTRVDHAGTAVDKELIA